MKTITIQPAKLSGTVSIPPSKSMAHRAILCAFLSEGESVLENVELSNDILASCRAVEALGAEIDIHDQGAQGRKKLVIQGNGRVKIKKSTLQCGESGTTSRFIIPVTRLTPEPVTICGEGKLADRPFDVYYPIFKASGISCEMRNSKLPMTLSGELKPGDFEVRGDISSQFISGLLLALPLLHGDSVLSVTTPLESTGYIEMTLEMQKRFGIRIDYLREENKFLVPGRQKYSPQRYQVEGDWSQAAFWLAAGAISGPVEIMGLTSNSLQGDIVIEEFLRRMGAKISWQGKGLVAEKAPLHGIEMDVSQCPDLVPVLAVLGALAGGETRIFNAARLRFKESDRLKAITTELKALGAKISEQEDSLSIEGIQQLLGGQVHGWNDHRIVMAAAIAAIACEKGVTLEGCEAVNKSYPSFWDHYMDLGGNVR